MFAVVDTIACAAVAFEAIILAGLFTYEVYQLYQACITRHGCENFAIWVDQHLGPQHTANNDPPPPVETNSGGMATNQEPPQTSSAPALPPDERMPQVLGNPPLDSNNPVCQPLPGISPLPLRGPIIFEAASLKQLKLALGRAGVPTRSYTLRKATRDDLEQMRQAGYNVDPPAKFGRPNAWGYTARDGAGNLIMDKNGRPIIVFTPLGLESLETAVRTFGHESQHIFDWLRGKSEDYDVQFEKRAEEAGEELWRLLQRRLE